MGGMRTIAALSGEVRQGQVGRFQAEGRRRRLDRERCAGAMLKDALCAMDWTATPGRRTSKLRRLRGLPAGPFRALVGLERLIRFTAPGRMDPLPVCWDGGSPSYYLHNWMALTDYTVWSPQVEAMNWVFMLDEVHMSTPRFLVRIVHLGRRPGPGMANDKLQVLCPPRGAFHPWARYEGFVQYGMWLTRPRVVRDFRGYLETIEYAGPYFQPILDSVDRVYTDPVLQKFWRKRNARALTAKGKHPFQAGIPTEYQNIDRWFLLDTNLTPKELRPEEFDNAQPPARQVEVPVFPLAMVMGTAPKREWLVFAHSPKQGRVGVEITLPEYGPITVDMLAVRIVLTPREGSTTRSVQPIMKGGPASFELKAPRFVELVDAAEFSVADKFSPAGPISAVKWDFGDGSHETGDQVAHRFAKPGQYLVRAEGMQNDKEVALHEVPIFVGPKPEEGLVCRLLMKGASREGMKSWIWISTWDKVDHHMIPGTRPEPATSASSPVQMGEGRRAWHGSGIKRQNRPCRNYQ